MDIDTIKEHLGRQFHLPDDQIEQLLPNFIATLQEHMAVLEMSVHSGDMLQIGKAAHKIKGAFLNLGLQNCAVLAEEIEACGKGEDSSIDYHARVDQLQKELAEILQS